MAEERMPQLVENVSKVDRIIRVVLGVALITFSMVGGVAEPVAGLIRIASIVPLATGMLGWCPAYQAAGFIRGVFGRHGKVGHNGRRMVVAKH